jgi:hypothetical protein
MPAQETDAPSSNAPKMTLLFMAFPETVEGSAG